MLIQLFARLPTNTEKLLMDFRRSLMRIRTALYAVNGLCRFVHLSRDGQLSRSMSSDSSWCTH